MNTFTDYRELNMAVPVDGYQGTIQRTQHCMAQLSHMVRIIELPHLQPGDILQFAS